MRNHYSLWVYILLGILVVLAVLYALPNLYGENPAIQITSNEKSAKVDQPLIVKLTTQLKKQSLPYKKVELDQEALLIRFYDTETQLKAKEVVKAVLGEHYTVALNLAPATPKWLEKLNAFPIKLGLDLRGGVHFLLEVDIEGVLLKREEALMKSINKDLRERRIRYTGMVRNKQHEIVLFFREDTTRNVAFSLLRNNYPQLIVNRQNTNARYQLSAKLSFQALNDIRQYTIDQTMTTLRNRVDELGVAEAVVQQQGMNRIAIDLPGIQDSARAKQILGDTATLEFHLVDTSHDAEAAQKGVVPIGTRLYYYEGRPLLLKTQLILAGDSITNATSGFDETGRPNVSIQLGGGAGESFFTQVTRKNIGKPMAIVYVETHLGNKFVEGKLVRVRRKLERIISVANIRDVLGSHFQITGLQDQAEAKKLALLLRAGSLPAGIDIVEERLVGPTLGAENIERGLISLAVGMGIILIVMMLYYRLFGVFANVALILNVIFLIALLSVFGAVLTLPGIAGIVLTVGMAVDANVLIYERIREELRNGLSTQAAIYAGYERALSTIIDANVTTLIVAIVLFAVGSGAIKGFAVTLTLGLLTSMLTGITYTRAIVNLVYGHRQVKKLSIGI